MNIKNLKEGMVIKNYKELCEILGIKVVAGNSKIKQLEEFSYYCDYTKEGNKFIINKINNQPMLKIEDILKTKNSKYIKLLSNIILEYLYNNQTELKEIKLIKLFSVLGITNDNYEYGDMFKKELSQLYDIQLKSVYFFYSNTKNEYKKIIERCLNNLQSRSVLFWKKCVMIVDKENKRVYKANDEEEKYILDTQREALEYLGYFDMYNLMKNIEDFKKFNNIIKNELGFNYYFAYDITIGKKAIEIEYKETFKQDVNKLIIDKTSNMFSSKNFKKFKHEYKILINLLTDINNNEDNFFNVLHNKRIENNQKHKQESEEASIRYIEDKERIDRKYKDPYK